MKVTAYNVEIIKGKYKGIKGISFDPFALNGAYPMVSVFDEKGTEYWVGAETIKTISSFEFDYPMEKEKHRCMDCKHFKRFIKGQKGAIKGGCRLKTTSSWIDMRYGKTRACKRFEEKEKKDG